MATDVVMPRLSDTMDSGTVAKWLKQVGDQVKRGDIIAEIETDKANMELESYSNGVLARIIVPEGKSAALGEPIAVIAASADEAKTLQSDAGTGEDGSATGLSPPIKKSDDKAVQEPATSPNGRQIAGADAQDQPDQGPPAAPQLGGMEPEERIKASPLARRLAQEHDIDLRSVDGTGPNGRITKEDVQNQLRLTVPAAGAREQQAPTAAPESEETHAPVSGEGLRGAQPVEMTRMQRTIARRMSEARFSAPDFVLTAEIDMTEARTLLHSLVSVEGAPRIGSNDLLIKAIAMSLGQHPEVNSGWENDGIARYTRINVGFAVAISGGLVVPVIRDTAHKTLGQISAEAKELIQRARGGKLAPADYEGGTFSISNLGMYGIDQFTAIINAPEACILGVGEIIMKPVVVDGEVTVRDRMRITLSCDHRVVNGAQGAEFLQTVRRLLEHPLLALL
ncbi:MAG: dihydrolipoamide acetyltransferase family protein [Chloroflexota bacterium]